MTDTDTDPSQTSSSRRIARDIGLGFAGVYIVSAAICVVGMDGGLAAALGIALLPAMFAGPFIGALMTLQRYLASEAAPRSPKGGL